MMTDLSTPIHNVPVEILTKIFSYLKVKHQNNASLVCTKWRNILECVSVNRVLRLSEPLKLTEHPISVFRNDRHPFTAIIFDAVEDFPEEINEFYDEVNDVVKELTFRSCYGLNVDTVDSLLLHLMSVEKITVEGSHSLEPGQLPHQHESVKILDFRESETPDWYIEEYVKSFPHLKELIVSSSTYHLWDAREDCEINFNKDATSTAFGDWVKRLSKMANNLSLYYEYGMVANTDILLKDLLEIPNLNTKALTIDTANTSVSALRTFCEVNGSQLKKLQLKDAKIEYLKIINTHCTKIEKLVLKFTTNCNFPVLENIADLKNLIELKISAYEGVDIELTTVCLSFKKLHTFIIDVEQSSQLVTFDWALKSMPFLKHLDLTRCIISTTLLALVLELCKTLEILCLNKGEQITDECLFGDKNLCLNSLKHLEVLNLNGCSNVSNSSIKMFSFAEICRLGLREMKLISYEGIVELCKNCPTIEQLDLNGCSAVDDNCVEFISKNLKNLKDIDLSGTSVTGKALDFIAEDCKNIKNVNISYKPSANSKAAEVLLQKRILHFLSAVAMNNISETLVIPENINE